MTDDKSKNGNGGGFFDDDDDLLEEHTVVDTEVLKKLNDKMQTEEEEADLIVDPELLDEVEVEAKIEQEYKMPPKASDPPVPSEIGGQPLVSGSEISVKDQEKINRIHQMFEEPDDPASSVVADEKTVILPDDEISGMSKKPSAKLVIMDGPEKDKEYKIEYNEIFVGRGVENDFVISDRSISRKHFRIRRRLDEYICVDLQSGNGTRINGEKVEEAVLNTGDVIAAGKSSFKFVDESKEEQAAFAVVEQAEVKETKPEPVPEVKEEPKPEPVKEVKPVEEPEPVQETEPQVQQEKEAPTRRLEPMSAHRSAYDDIEKPASSNGLIIAIIGIVLVVAALMVFQQIQKDEAATKVAEPAKQVAVEKTPEPVKAPEPVAKQDVSSLMAEGNRLMAEKSFAKALDSFNAVLAIDVTNKEAQSGRDKALIESTNQKVFEEGKKLADENKIESAILRLKAVGADSVFYAEAQATVNRLELNRYDDEIETGKKLLEQKQYDKAITAFAAVLKKQPENIEAGKYKVIAEKEKEVSAIQKEEDRKAAALKLEAEKKEIARKKEEARKAAELKRAEEQRKEEAKRKKLEAERKKAEAEKKRLAEQERIRKEKEEKRRLADLEKQRKLAEEAKKRKVTSNADLDQGYSLYKAGNIDKAIAEFDTIVNGRGNTSVMSKAKKIIGQIKKFETVYNKGKREHDSKNIKNALTSLKEAMRQDLDIVKGSVFSGKLATMIADMYYEVGKQAMQKDQYETAMKAYNRALKFDSGHALSKRALQDLKQQAQKLYYQGYAVKDSDPDKAEKLWETVLKIAPKSSQWYKKAESGLEEL